MDLIFKLSGSPSTPPVIGDSNFKNHYSGVNIQMAWDDILPAIRQATEKYVLPYIGEELYNDLAEKYQAGTTLTDEQAKILELLQDTVAYYTIYHILPEKTAVVSSMGVMSNTPEGGAAPANQWSWKAKRWSALENGDSFLDKALAYLEKQTAIYFNLWRESTAYNVKTSDFIRTTAQLDEYLNIQNSRRSFISLIRFCKQVEEDIIAPLLCTDLYEAVLLPTPTTANALLLPKIRRIVAYLGAFEAVPHHRITIDGDGFRVVSQTDQFDDRRNQTNNIHAQSISAFMTRCQNRGEEALKSLKKFLEDNIADYPDYATSSCREIAPTKAHSITQSPDGIGTVGIF